MKLSLIQMNAGPDRDDNVGRACQFIDQAAENGSDLIVLPEFFNTIYFPQYRDFKYIQWAEQDDGYTMTHIKDKAREHGVYIIATIYEDHAPGIRFDTAMVVDSQGQIVGKYRKVHPSAYMALEKIYFRYGSKFPVFRIGDWRVGIVICFDLYLPESARCVILNGAELVVVPFCAPFGYLSSAVTNLPRDTGEAALNKEAWLRQWDAQTSLRASENMVYLAACNHTGQEGEAVFAGESRIVDPEGNVISKAGDENEIINAELDRDLFVHIRQEKTFLRDRRPDLYKAITSETEDLPL